MGEQASDAASALAKALKDVNVAVRSRAAWALGEMRQSGRAAVPNLREALLDAEPSVQSAAREALESIEGGR